MVIKMSDLDKRVAEALGYEIEDREGVDFYIDTARSAKYMHTFVVSSVFSFTPSTNWQQAGELLEKYKIAVTPPLYGRPDWSAEVKVPKGDDNHRFHFHNYAPTPQEAICLAVIALLESKDETRTRKA